MVEQLIIFQTLTYSPQFFTPFVKSTTFIPSIHHAYFYYTSEVNSDDKCKHRHFHGIRLDEWME